MVKNNNKCWRGLTLVEVMVTFAILAFVLSGLLALYLNIFLLSDISRQTILASNAAEAEMELIKNTNFDNLLALNGNTFNLNGFPAADAIGVINVSNTAYTDLLRVRVVISFRQRGQRIVGEDRNLNGVLDTGEDTNGNGQIDSSVEIVTLISR
ncbi:MAG: prepilin-type N-terminal cleavage/methylation domain-containing protein [Candidatus Omnitrophota bacterium]